MSSNTYTMDEIFREAFQELIGIEGGYVCDPTDRGGETKYGISKRAYPDLDIKNLTLKDAQFLYYKDYWLPNSLSSFSTKISKELFDTSVNMGVAYAARMLQRALNLMNRNESDFKDLIKDGVIGSKTIEAYDKVNHSVLLKVLNGLQFMRYVEICEYNPSQEKFFNGWMKRI